MSKEPIIREKHKEVLKKMLENVGMSREQAQLEVGYSENYARKGRIAKTASWEELMDEYLPDEELTKAHKEGLAANRVISANIIHGDADEKTNDFIEVPDYPTRHKYLETGYKIKRKFPKEGINIDKAQINITPIYGGQSHVQGHDSNS